MTILFGPRMAQAAEGLPRRGFTMAEVEAPVAVGVMEEDERVELIGGALVPISAKGGRREGIKTASLNGGIGRAWTLAPSRPGRRFASRRTRTRHRISSSTPKSSAPAVSPARTCSGWSRPPNRRRATTRAEGRRCTRASASANSGPSTRSGSRPKCPASLRRRVTARPWTSPPGRRGFRRSPPTPSPCGRTISASASLPATSPTCQFPMPYVTPASRASAADSAVSSQGRDWLFLSAARTPRG